MRLRVTTVPISIILDSDNAQLEASFDQEAALVLVAREAVKNYRLTSTRNSLVARH